MTPTRPRVSLIMPVYNEASNLPDVLASLERQSYPHERLSLIAVDGASSDGSAACIEAWLAARDIGGRVLINPRRAIPSSLNVALAQIPSDEYVVRVDSHTLYGDRYVEDIVGAFERWPVDVACVGGSQLPAPTAGFEAALVASLLTNPMGLGGADFRHAREARFVSSVYLGAWRPGVLQTLGGFDERWQANEDSELAARIWARGWRVLWVPLECRYRVNRGAIATARQWARYGFWRAKTVQRHRHALKLRHLLPPAALMVAAFTAATPARAALFGAYVLYAAAVFRARAQGEALPVTLAATAFFPICQALWGIGFMRGLTTPPPGRQPAPIP